jgi:hypothetical protein
MPGGVAQLVILFLGAFTLGPVKPAARQVFKLYSAPVLGDPYVSVGFGGELTNLGRMALRDTSTVH